MRVRVTFEGWKPLPYKLEYLQPGVFKDGQLTPDEWKLVRDYFTEGEALTAGKHYLKGLQVIWSTSTE